MVAAHPRYLSQVVCASAATMHADRPFRGCCFMACVHWAKVCIVSGFVRSLIIYFLIKHCWHMKLCQQQLQRLSWIHWFRRFET
jgi:hypothetical protein